MCLSSDTTCLFKASLSVSLESALRPCRLARDLPPHAASTSPTLRFYVLAAVLGLLSVGSGNRTQVQGKPFTESPTQLYPRV